LGQAKADPPQEPPAFKSGSSSLLELI